MTTQIQPLYLLRKQDINGVSGTGIVAIGSIFPDGTVILQWMTFTSSIAIFKSVECLREVHGHNGATEVVMGAIPSSDKKRRSKRGSKKSNKEQGT